MSKHREVALDLLYQGRYELALEAIARGLAADPTDADALALRSYILTRLNRLAEAFRTISEAVSHGPESPYVHYMRGLVCKSDHCIREALSAFDEAIRLNPDWSSPYVAKADIHHSRGKELKRILDERNEPDLQDPWFCDLGTTQQEFSLAERYARRSVELDPVNAGHQIMLAKVCLSQGNLDEANACAAQAVTLTPDGAEAHLVRGQAQLANGDHQSALGHFMEAKRLDPADDEARAGVVEALALRNRFFRVCLQSVERVTNAFTYLEARYRRVFGKFPFTLILIACAAAMAFAFRKQPLIPRIVVGVVFVFVGALAVAAIVVLIALQLLHFSFQFRPGTRRWLSPGQVWLANAFVVFLAGVLLSVVLILVLGVETPIWLIGPFLSCAGIPIGLLAARYWTDLKYDRTALAVVYAVLSAGIPIALALIRPFEEITGYIICILVWFVLGFVGFAGDLESLMQSGALPRPPRDGSR